jgi:hypothetical protein
MTYASGGLIQASDYNGFAGGDAGANVSGQLNTVLGIGFGNSGYGQTAVSNVSVAGQVTAAQWTSLVNGVNNVRKHQDGGSFSNLGTYTAGTTINATNDVSSNLTTAYTNRLASAASGPLVNQPSQNATQNSSSAAEQTMTFTRTATFGSSDQARYFFNAGGNIAIVIGTVTNTGGTSRGASLGNIVATLNGKGMTAAAQSPMATPAPYSETTDLTTNYGYYGQSTSLLTTYEISGSNYGAAYSGQTGKVQTKVTGTAGSYGGKGETISFTMTGTSPAQSPAVNDSINITIAHYLQVRFPSSTYLANTWGGVTFG